MKILLMIMFFILGSVFASFLSVVGIRLGRDESFIKGRSHCDNCGKSLHWYELIPIVSYLIQFGKCRGCKKSIGIRYFLYEIISAVLFSLSYYIFGISIDLLIALSLICILIVVVSSDIEYMIIPDQILIIGVILLLILNTIKNGIMYLGISIINGLIAFIIMLALKKIGDIMFKKESLGGGDIKLMGMIGILFNYQSIIANIFLSSFIALPYAIYITISKKDGIMPFGPFLSIGAIILFLFGLNNIDILDIIYSLI